MQRLLIALTCASMALQVVLLALLLSDREPRPAVRPASEGAEAEIARELGALRRAVEALRTEVEARRPVMAPRSVDAPEGDSTSAVPDPSDEAPLDPPPPRNTPGRVFLPSGLPDGR